MVLERHHHNIALAAVLTLASTLVVASVSVVAAQSGKDGDDPFKSLLDAMKQDNNKSTSVFSDTKLPKTCGGDDQKSGSSDDDKASAKQYASPVTPRMCIRPRRPIQPRPR